MSARELEQAELIHSERRMAITSSACDIMSARELDTEDKMLGVTINDIEVYLSEVKNAIRHGRYRIDINSNRQNNTDLFIDYVIDEAKAREILLSLVATDFSEILQNEHMGFEYEKLYVFGKDVQLLERIGNDVKTVSLYIKFNKLENCYVIVISFHEQRYPLKYYFK